MLLKLRHDWQENSLRAFHDTFLAQERPRFPRCAA